MHLSALYIYPVKSLGGIALTESVVEERGLQYDRRWMLVDAEGTFLTQRNYPQLALLQTTLLPEGLQITAKPTSQQIIVPYQPQTDQKPMVNVWSDRCRSQLVSSEANTFFSDYMHMDCRLVYMPDTTKRRVDGRYAVADNLTSFSDGYPFLMIGQSSLDDLNGRLSEAVPMNRFRPNLVISGAEAYAEDNWHEVRVGETCFFGVKPCARCIMTTIDQETAQTGKEPLQTLATYRNIRNRILFGQNMVFGRTGNHIRVGDALEVISHRK